MSRFPLAAITDEFSPDDLGAALEGMSRVGMTGAELRVIGGRNALDLTDDDIRAARAAVEARGMTVVGLASPLLKCVLPDSPPLDSRVQHDVFGSAYTFEDQPRLTARAFEIAGIAGARLIRVFSYWRTTDPERTFDRVASALHALGEQASRRGLVIGLENEHACNVATAQEAAQLLRLVDHPAVKLVWDPANASVVGEVPYPDGYSHLPKGRIAHVHAKDCTVSEQKPTWGPIGDMGIDWIGQLNALERDGYRGWISLETHWQGPHGNKFEASMICGERLRTLVGGA